MNLEFLKHLEWIYDNTYKNENIPPEIPEISDNKNIESSGGNNNISVNSVSSSELFDKQFKLNSLQKNNDILETLKLFHSKFKDNCISFYLTNKKTIIGKIKGLTNTNIIILEQSDKNTVKTRLMPINYIINVILLPTKYL